MSIRLAITCIALAACYQPRSHAGDIDPGLANPTDLFAPDASAIPICPDPDPSPLSALHVRVRTTPAGGHFAPRNVGAVWIERADGAFVKTLARWGEIRARWLTRFAAASNNNLVDAVTGPTQLSHTTHDLVWRLTDLVNCEIATGGYKAVFEMTDGDITGPSVAIEFAKDQVPATVVSPDESSFHDLLIDLQ